MDTLIFLVSAAVVVTLGYGVFWTVRAIRRVGLRRFARAVVRLGRAVLVAAAKLFTPAYLESEENSGKKDDYGFVDAYNDVLDGKRAQRLSDEGSQIGPGPHF